MDLVVFGVLMFKLHDKSCAAYKRIISFVTSFSHLGKQTVCGIRIELYNLKLHQAFTTTIENGLMLQKRHMKRQKYFYALVGRCSFCVNA